MQVLTRELHAAEFALHVADFEIAQAKAALMQAQHPASEKSEPLRIIAPVDGYVLNVYEESARVVTTNMPIMEVGDPQDLEAEIELLSSDAVGVAAGADVSIEHWGGESPLRGRVSVVEPGAFTKISALGVEEQRVNIIADFPEREKIPVTLGDGFRVEAKIVIWEKEEVVKVPTSALFRHGDGWAVFLVEGDRAFLRPVTLGKKNGLAAEVLTGLATGDTVVFAAAFRRLT